MIHYNRMQYFKQSPGTKYFVTVLLYEEYIQVCVINNKSQSCKLRAIIIVSKTNICTSFVLESLRWICGCKFNNFVFEQMRSRQPNNFAKLIHEPIIRHCIRTHVGVRKQHNRQAIIRFFVISHLKLILTQNYMPKA